MPAAGLRQMSSLYGYDQVWWFRPIEAGLLTEKVFLLSKVKNVTYVYSSLLGTHLRDVVVVALMSPSGSQSYRASPAIWNHTVLPDTGERANFSIFT